jgi:membrane-associated phospholipid phosphatase
VAAKRAGNRLGIVAAALVTLLAPAAHARAQAAAAPLVAPAAPGASAALTPASQPGPSTPAVGVPVPSLRYPRSPAFQLSLEYDLPVLAIGIVFAASRLLLAQRAYCAPLCTPESLNAMDRKTAGFWSEAWQRSSDAGLYVLVGGTALVLFLDEGFLPGLNDGVVIVESALAAMATASIMTLAARRPRPFLYGEEAPLAKRNSSDASLSFLSSHASTAFATATALFMAMRRLHARTELALVVTSAAALLAGFVATSRVLGGMHFITDALGGAVIGVSMGVLIPTLHDAPIRVVPSMSTDRPGLSFTARF